jgi:hypothetical protein
LPALPAAPWQAVASVVLFNTLAYAKFFAVVFLVAWMLVNRRWAAVLPWAAVGAYAASQPPTVSGLGIALLRSASRWRCARRR